MKKLLSFILCIACFIGLNAQSLTIEQCYDLARENYPAISQRKLIEQSAEFNVENAKRNWLPKISLLAQATYQSDVMAFPEGINNMFKYIGVEFEGLRKDQYKAAIQIEQIIYGGGVVKSQIDIAKAESEALKQNWEVEIYNIYERINQIFFGTLLLQEKINEIDILINELNRNYNNVKSYKLYGVAGQNDLDAVEVEILSVQQQKAELISTQKAYCTMLGIMIGLDTSNNFNLVTPNEVLPSPELQINRPELKYLEAKKNILDAKSNGINSSIKPQIGVFFQGVYGNPGLNLFKDMQKNQWSPYFITGVKFQWNISGFYTRKNNISQIDMSRLQIDLQKETFLYNINLKKTQESIAIDRMRDVMATDDKIIELRGAIRKRTEIQIENGTATIGDLLRDLHSENLARQNKVAHEIELLKTIYDLKFTINN
jgi:outer membrane protein TolC